MAVTQVIPTGGGAVAVRTGGRGRWMLMLHGIPGSAANWKHVAAIAHERGFRTAAPNLLGFGGSSRPRGMQHLGIEAQAHAVEDVAVDLGVDDAVVVAHDYGVPIAVRLADRRPDLVAALVLGAGNVFTDTPIPAPLRVVTLPVVGGALARAAMSSASQRMMLKVGVGRPRPVLRTRDYLGDRAQRRAIATIFTSSLRDLQQRYDAVERILPTLRQPTVVVWGERDPFFPVDQARRTAQAIPGARLRIEPGAGHFLPEERPSAFVDAVLHHQRGVAP